MKYSVPAGTDHIEGRGQFTPLWLFSLGEASVQLSEKMGVNNTKCTSWGVITSETLLEENIQKFVSLSSNKFDRISEELCTSHSAVV